VKPASLALALVSLVATSFASCSSEDGPTAAEIASAECLSSVGELYDRRIAPLLATDRPKTCNQCHLSGVDLSLFVRDDMCETRACLFEKGLIDPENPDQSVVLTWIARAEPESDLITQDVIDEEYEGFREFVEKLASCGGESCAGVRCPLSASGEACGRAPEPTEPPLVPAGTGCDDLSLETAFRDTVYVFRDRCFPCHFSNQKLADAEAPRWIVVDGGCETGSLQTFHNVIEGGYADTTAPDQSLLLLKPLTTSGGGVVHGGGKKFHGTDDPSYVSFLSFLEHYAACANGTATP
jgi:hypothetical protein